MNLSRTGLVCSVILAAGCGGDGSSGMNNANPYANNAAPQSSSPPPGSNRPTKSRPTDSAAESDTDRSAEIVVPEAGYAAEMSVPLVFSQYLRFARRSSEMLREMADIHAQVSESGEAAPQQQQRWGELTATHTKLVRDVVDSAYPPEDLARDLRLSALPALRAALQHAEDVMEEYDAVEGGLTQPHAEAEKIFEHLSKNLTEAELAEMPAKTEEQSSGTSEP